MTDTITISLGTLLLGIYGFLVAFGLILCIFVDVLDKIAVVVGLAMLGMLGYEVYIWSTTNLVPTEAESMSFIIRAGVLVLTAIYFAVRHGSRVAI